MGMFDTVMIKCPHCGDELEFQTKSGECVLSYFTQEAIPPEIARDLNGISDECYHCGEKIKLEVISPIEMVSMRAIKDL